MQFITVFIILVVIEFKPYEEFFNFVTSTTSERLVAHRKIELDKLKLKHSTGSPEYCVKSDCKLNAN